MWPWGVVALPSALGQRREAEVTTEREFTAGGSASGYPARFVDVAQEAGLTRTIYYGEVDTSDYISEANGCGVAFYDYDNDGWLDILLLNGSRSSGIPDEDIATNRPVPQQPRRDIHGCHSRSRLDENRLGQRRLASETTTTTDLTTCSLPTEGRMSCTATTGTGHSQT